MVQGQAALNARDGDLLSVEVTDLTARVEATNFGLRWFLADKASADVVMDGRNVSVSNLVGLLGLAGRFS